MFMYSESEDLSNLGGPNVVVELPPGGIQHPRTLTHGASTSESFTMISQMNDLALQSQADSSMSSYVHVQHEERVAAQLALLEQAEIKKEQWNHVSRPRTQDEKIKARLAQLMQDVQRDEQVKQELEMIGDWNHVSKPRRMIGDKKHRRQLREDRKNKMRPTHKKQKLDHSNSSSESEVLSAVEEIDADEFSYDWRHRRERGTCTYMANTLVAILAETPAIPSLKLAKEVDSLRSDLVNFFAQTNNKGRPRSCFIGFKIANQNQFEDIQANGFSCGPGFHLCKTIENAISFHHQFSKIASDPSSEHLWMVLGTEAPPSGDPRDAEDYAHENHAWPLACINLLSIMDKNNSPCAFGSLVFELKKWAKDLSVHEQFSVPEHLM